MASDDEDAFFDQLEPRAEVVMECLGLALDYEATSLGVPVEVVVIAKSMEDGKFQYHIMSNQGANSMECLGMVRWGQMILEDGILNNSPEEPAEEDIDDTGPMPPVT